MTSDLSHTGASASAAPAPPPAPRRDGGVRGPLRLVAAVLALLLVAFGVLTVVTLLARSTEHRSATYDGITSVDVDLAFELLQLTAGDASTVQLDRSYSWSIGKPRVSQRRVGDRLVVTSSGCGFSPGLGCTGSVRLDVPASVRLHLRTSNSGLTLRDLTGDIDAQTSNGGVVASGLTGSVRLRTSNGRVEATGLRSPTVDAASSNGSVRLSFDAAPTQASAVTSNGGIEVVVPRDGSPYRVDATTSNGTRQVDVPTDRSAARTIGAHTSNGSVRVVDRP